VVRDDSRYAAGSGETTAPCDVYLHSVFSPIFTTVLRDRDWASDCAIGVILVEL
jgi:hypothetical protein